MSSDSPLSVLWTPHPKQIEALERSEFEILYGGSRGGGKTDAGIAWMVEYTHDSRYRGLVLRRNSDDLRDWIDRANTLYSQLGARKIGNPPEFHWPSGAVIRTGHLNDDQAYTKYQGHEYQKMLIEELTQIAEEKHYLRLLSSCRSVYPYLQPQVFLTTNPGNKGHIWVKQRFIDPAPPGTPIWSNGRARVFIQATMDDNPTLIENDPNYVANIESLKDVDYETYMAWKYGDWDRFSGQVFKEFARFRHVMKPMIPNITFDHYLSMDWGYSENSAFAAYLHCVIKMKTSDGQLFQRVITYREWYGNLKTPYEWAEIIYNDCKKLNISPRGAYVDPAMLNRQTDGSVSISKLMTQKWEQLNNQNLWCSFHEGGRSRPARIAHVHNWLSSPSKKDLPYWIMTENCVHLIETLPKLVYDDKHVDDVDTTMEDHAYDSVGYFLSQVKFIPIKLGAFTYSSKPMVLATQYNAQGQELALEAKIFAEEYSK